MRSPALLAGALAALLFVLAGLGDHVAHGVVRPGARSLDVAAGLALGALLAVPLAALVALVLARASGVFLRRWGATALARAALLGFLFVASEGLWSMLVYHEYPGYSLNTRHLAAYAAGILPLAALSFWASGRAMRRPWSTGMEIGVGVGWIAFFVGVAGWLPALYPAGTSPHLAHGGAAFGVLVACVGTALVIVARVGAATRGLRRGTLAGIAVLALLAVLFVVGWRDGYAARDAAARGGRVSRTTLRYTQFVLFPHGHGLRALAQRAAPPPEEQLLGPESAEDDSTWRDLLERRPTGLVIFTIDAARAGATRPREGVVFTNHHATAPGTRESLTSLFTGHWVWEQPRPSFFDQLRGAGWKTIAVGYAVGSNQYIQNGDGAKGFVEIAPRPASTEHAMAPSLTDALVEKLATAGDEKFAAWVHHLDPHAPYDPPGSTDRERYAGEIARTEAEVDRAIEAMRSRGLLDRTAIVISADHGEHFGEHGMFFHNMTVYQEVLRVPLLVIAPGGSVRARIDRATSGLHLQAALLAWLGVTSSADTPELFQPRRDGRVHAFLSVQPDRWRPTGVGTVLRGPWKLIFELRTRAAELYDLASDPGELHNVVDERPDVAAALARDLLDELERTGVSVD